MLTRETLTFVVAWANPTLVPILRGSTVGRGGAAGSHGELFNGTVVIDTTQRLGRTVRQHNKNMQIVTNHEIAHAIGLDHVTDPRQIMAAGVYAATPQFANGDLRGLRAVGAAGGCTKNSRR